MNLYLVQHGEAKPRQEDPERPLTEKGWSDVRKVAAFAADKADVQVQRILHSGKKRAQQTAGVFAEYLNPTGGITETEGLQPLADPSIWEERIAATNDDIVLVGHLPHLARLAGQLLCQDADKGLIDFKMGGIACLARDESRVWSIRWMVTPQILD